MGWRFRKSINLGGGVKLNLGKKGVGVSAGVKGLRVSTGPSGTRATASIPGTGVSYTQEIGGSKRSTRQQQAKKSADGTGWRPCHQCHKDIFVRQGTPPNTLLMCPYCRASFLYAEAVPVDPHPPSSVPRYPESHFDPSALRVHFLVIFGLIVLAYMGKNFASIEPPIQSEGPAPAAISIPAALPSSITDQDLAKAERQLKRAQAELQAEMKASGGWKAELRRIEQGRKRSEAYADRAMPINGPRHLTLPSASTASEDAPKSSPVFRVPELAFASSARVDRVLGPPYSTTPVRRLSEEMPGEWRNYTLPDQSDLQVKFYRDRAIQFSCFLNEASGTAEDALRRIGVNTDDLTLVHDLGTVKGWRGTSGQTTYVFALASHEEGKGYAFAQAVLENPQSRAQSATSGWR